MNAPQKPSTATSIWNIFFKGLLTVLPVALTLYLLIWLVQALEGMFSFFLGALLPEAWSFPGLSLLLGIGFIFLAGLLLQLWLVRWIWSWGEALLERIPLIQEVYTSIRQAFRYLAGQQQAVGGKVVMVTIENPPMRLLGLVTCENLSKAPKGLQSEDTIGVYLPMSFQIGGYTVYVPRSSVQPVDMTAKEALRWSLMGGVIQNSENRGQKTEARNQRSEVRGQKSEVRNQRSEIRGQRSEVRKKK
ncbi:MAG: DUF502 domain-containing protein [Pseudomonadota bacterium]